MAWHERGIEETLKNLGARMEGMTESEAQERLERYGKNEIIRGKPLTPLEIFLKQFSNFFVLILFFAAGLAYAVSFMPGEGDRFLTSLFILGIIAITIGLGFFEEYKAQKELRGLDKLLRFKATVVRDGVHKEIDADQVVPGDILVLSHGQKVPADARVIMTHSLRTDESALTGESLGVEKSEAAVALEAPLAERTSMVFGSTHITHGKGTAVAVSTGMNTEVGRIAVSLGHIGERPTPFEIEVQVMARQMTLIVGALAVIVALILFFWLHEQVVDVLLNTLSLAVATIPESLPIVLIFALALGARQMASRKAVIRRLAVVESLGSVDTICTDKTGTLTQNVMTVERILTDHRPINLEDINNHDSDEIELIRAGALCNEAIIVRDPESRLIGDPVDTAMYKAAQTVGLDVELERTNFPKVNEIPFSSERKMMTTIHKSGHGFTAYCKGAAGVILSRCSSMVFDGKETPLDLSRMKVIHQALNQFEEEAMYVLALAEKKLETMEINDETEQNLTLLGFQAMKDPARPEAASAIAEAQGAGIRVIMITGDNKLTARAIGKQIGIGNRFLESTEVETMSQAELRDKMRNVDIIARATPETKQKVLQALQDEGHFVAMTGDGVNDAPALKQSDVGVAMGVRGADIAKESSDMVLLDDNFKTIVTAVEEGRRIFDNIRKFTNYLLSTSLGEVFVVLALSIGGYFPLSAQMLLWVNVVTDLVPAAALAADPAVPKLMNRRPRHHDEPILNRAIYATIAGSILRTLVAYLFIFWVGLKFGGVTYARTMLFTSIVLHAFTRILVVRQLDALSIWSNRPLLWSYGFAICLQLLALYTPVSVFFGVVPLDWRAWAVMIPVVALSSVTGVYMTRWILKLAPLWED
ncbi:MAG: cation-transporting P-type ATPase [Desulfomonilaceae bacterium]|jgi:Ca2+-transporting ATPase